MRSLNVDVAVVGAGPAGCAAATLLAQHGHDVALFEREPGPRYHVGESLLPMCRGVLDRMGAVEAIEGAAFQRKDGVRFVRADGRPSQPFYFASHLQGPEAATWQVDRERFDEVLLRRAAECGVKVYRGHEATALQENDGVVTGLKVTHQEGHEVSATARWVVDASGRDGLSMRQYRWRNAERALNRVAVWGYYSGGTRAAGRDEGATTVCSLATGGWIWHIPLANDMTSVGVVARVDQFEGELQDREQAYQSAIAAQPWVQEQLRVASRVGELRLTRNYSYFGARTGKPGLLLCGDAFAFLDPVFSSGMYIALTSGGMTADLIHRSLAGDLPHDEVESAYEDWLTTHIEPMRRLIHAFYDPAFSVGSLVRERPDLRGDLTDILVGNLDRDFTELMAELGERTRLPAPLSDRLANREDACE